MLCSDVMLILHLHLKAKSAFEQVHLHRHTKIVFVKQEQFWIMLSLWLLSWQLQHAAVDSKEDVETMRIVSRIEI